MTLTLTQGMYFHSDEVQIVTLTMTHDNDSDATGCIMLFISYTDDLYDDNNNDIDTGYVQRR